MQKRQAIRECKKLWRPVLEGRAKDKGEAVRLYPQARNYWLGCPFCDYVRRIKEDCICCPLVEQTGWECMDNAINFCIYPVIFASVIMALKE